MMMCLRIRFRRDAMFVSASCSAVGTYTVRVCKRWCVASSGRAGAVTRFRAQNMPISHSRSGSVVGVRSRQRCGSR